MNTFYNNKQKQVNDPAQKVQVTDFKKRQKKKKRIRKFLPVSIYLFRVSHKNIKAKCEIYLNSTMKYQNNVVMFSWLFIANFEQMSLGTIHKVRTLKFGDFQTHPPLNWLLNKRMTS